MQNTLLVRNKEAFSKISELLISQLVQLAKLLTVKQNLLKTAAGPLTAARRG